MTSMHSNKIESIMRSWVGGLIAWPWADRLILSSLRHWYFPLSCLWASARRANGDIDTFYTHVPIAEEKGDRTKTIRALKEFELARIQIANTEEKWRNIFFDEVEDGEQVRQDKLVNLESLRLDHRSHYNATRYRFRHLRKQVDLSVHQQFATPQEVQDIYGGDQQSWQQRFAVPTQFPDIVGSRQITKNRVNSYWIRFDSPSNRLDDIVYARVLEPENVPNPPTLIFGHGIGVEFDHWRNLIDVVDYFPQLGIRVIRPEAPWHGRRVPDGFYGGEYFLSTTPMGAFDLFTAQFQEWMILMDWARKNTTAPVAIGGSSLGAQCAQSTSIRANNLPRRLQPDALFLMTHCAHIWETALDSDLADIWGLHNPLLEMGWNRELMEQWLTKLDPPGVPCVAPENIVSVLGKSDRVTHYRSGKRLQQLWQLPSENTFSWPSGHFTVPMRMLKHTEPILKFKEIIERLQQD